MKTNAIAKSSTAQISETVENTSKVNGAFLKEPHTNCLVLIGLDQEFLNFKRFKNDRDCRK